MADKARMKVSTAAEYLDVSRRKLYELMQSGQIRWHYDEQGRLRYVLKADLDDYLARVATKGDAA